MIDRIAELVLANRIIAHESLVDAFGHVSVRCSDEPEEFAISRSLSPDQVTAADIQHRGLDGGHRSGNDDAPYAEVAIHAEVYRARADVNAVVHSHVPSVLPFSVSRRALRPLFHVGSLVGAHVPVWDIRTAFGDTDMLVRTHEQGADLARALGDATVVLMRGHGCVVVGASLQVAVLATYALDQNARLQLAAERLGDLSYLSAGETQLASQMLAQPLARERAWRWLSARAAARP